MTPRIPPRKTVPIPENLQSIFQTLNYENPIRKTGESLQYKSPDTDYTVEPFQQKKIFQHFKIKTHQQESSPAATPCFEGFHFHLLTSQFVDRGPQPQLRQNPQIPELTSKQVDNVMCTVRKYGKTNV